MHKMAKLNYTQEEKRYNFDVLQRSTIIFFITIFLTHVTLFVDPVAKFNVGYVLLPIVTLGLCFWVIMKNSFTMLFYFASIAFPVFALLATLLFGKIVQAPVALAIYICLLGTLYLPKRRKKIVIATTSTALLVSLYPYVTDQVPSIPIGPTQTYLIFIGCVCVLCYILYAYQKEQIRISALLIESLKEEEIVANQSVGPSPDVIRLISHDLRAPVANYSNIGKKISYLLDTNDTDRLNQLANELQSSGKEIQKLMDGMMAIASDNLNNGAIEYRQVDIAKQVKSVIFAYQKVAFSKSVQINVVSDSDTTVNNEANRLRILFSNFIDNALKFSDSGTTISINIEKSDRSVNWSITNTGRGFSIDQINVFNKGAYIPSTPGTNGEIGYGLGLASARQISKSINIDISLSSIENTSTVSLIIPIGTA